MLLREFYPRFGYEPDRVLPFEEAYPDVVAAFNLNFPYASPCPDERRAEAFGIDVV